MHGHLHTCAHVHTNAQMHQQVPISHLEKYLKIYPSMLKHKFTQKNPAMDAQLGHSKVLPRCASVSLLIQVPIQSGHLIVFAKKKINSLDY